MAPEHEVRPRAAFYDHESEEPRRGRRPAADWGVGEDIFDRMPSRFSRAERRAEHRDEIASHHSDDVPGDSRGADGDAARSVQRDGWRDGARGSRGSSRLVESWADDEPDLRGHVVVADRPGVDSWMDDAPLVPGESRTIVLGTDESPEQTPAEHESAARSNAPKPRRTVVISGHPDRLASRAQRPPRTAVERIGTSPDRIVAYAVALGFLLVLIAVLTTGQ